MKKIIGLLLIGMTITQSCQNKSNATIEDIIAAGNLNDIKLKRQEISDQQKMLNRELELLDSAISSIDNNMKVPLVTTIEAETSHFKHFLDLQGDVMTRQNVLIYPEMPGTLLKVYVKEGQQVKKGQLLAVIDDGGMESQLEQLRTQAALAKTTYERQKRLWDQKIGSEIQFLQAKTNFEATRNTVEQAESQLAKSRITAPFSGIIDDVIQDEGTVVSPGTGVAVFRIVNLSDMYISVDVPESYLEGVTKGKEVKVYFPVLGDSITTRVRQTGNFINPVNRSFNVEIPVPNQTGNIKPNLTARVQINDYSNAEAILIPQSVISENAEGEQYVYLASNTSDDAFAEATKMIVKTGRTQGDLVEVLSGIRAGDQIIKEGARTVREGQQIQIIQ
ncbi:efflux RND transporter periplasmic adaptor subunit [Lentiprolixibacter aurantiacus]|uniref:Efflux RND transporter periplasmic adaptor subunit n=1 Tax=Lentiprolixibacter aurantiacus TaxID=2993939 RepID=A0AAE3MKI4_9FLAO|nr:efflux RND transporter periplasmic adaptor subunit [Lentiprolixibacter aurantiacus]MCX2718732.1 efflux RND transporter periplasmic adaptor subunit [Lentiprolixibacter aurantiacus]